LRINFEITLKKAQGHLNDLKFKTNLGVDVRMVNFGSFTFLFVVTCRGWKNGNVPKFAFECLGKDGLCLIETLILARQRVSANGLRLCEEADFGAQNCQDSTNVDAR
jgi:hypothetical protein